MATWRPPFFRFPSFWVALQCSNVDVFRPALGSFGRQAAPLRVTAQFQRQGLRRGEQVLL